MRESPPLPLGFPKASRVIHTCGAHNEADFREYGEYEGERTTMPGEQALFDWEFVYTKFFGVPRVEKNPSFLCTYAYIFIKSSYIYIK